MATTVGGALLAVRQDDIKLMLAYASMSQLGYIVAAVALMSHLGWVTALYLTANHLAVKGILFLVAASVILRTGRRAFSGLGGKWLLLSAMMEKGWFLPIALGVLATLVGLLYMVRFVRATFLGAPQDDARTTSDAPWPIVAAQALLILGILVMTFFPKLLIVPISEAIDPAFASTLVWEEMSLELIYGYWNPWPTMLAAVALSAVAVAVLWLVRRGREANLTGAKRAASFYNYYQPLLAALTPPYASAFWTALAGGTQKLGAAATRLYTGNGQLYTLYVLYYFVVLYVACAILASSLI